MDLTEACLAQIDDRLNAFRHVAQDAALCDARRVEEAAGRGEPLGRLAGIPVAVKDNIEVAGMPITAGTRHLARGVPRADAPVTARLREAGAILLGKLHMSEWAIGATGHNVHFGPCRNAWDPARIAGGSSSGSGVAAASGMALVTLGTDTGGSARVPAALNGVCGLRPSGGRVSNRGSVPVAWTFDAICTMARRAADVAEVLAVIAGYDAEDPASIQAPVDDYVEALDRGAERLRIGLLSGWWLDYPAAAVADTVRSAGAALERAGAVVEEVELEGHAEAFEVTAELLLAEAAWFHRERLNEDPDMFAPDVRTRLERGAAIGGPRYGGARQRQRIWRRRVLETLAGRDLLLAPACGIPAPLIDESDPLETTVALTRSISLWVLARMPVMALPCGFVDGLPVGMQLIGRPLAEATVLQAAHAYQQVTDWHLRDPSR